MIGTYLCALCSCAVSTIFWIFPGWSGPVSASFAARHSSNKLLALRNFHRCKSSGRLVLWCRDTTGNLTILSMCRTRGNFFIHGTIETLHWSISTVLWVFWMIVICGASTWWNWASQLPSLPSSRNAETEEFSESSVLFGPLGIGVATRMLHLLTFTPVVLTQDVHGCPCFRSLSSNRHIFHCCIVLGTQMLCQPRTNVGKRIPGRTKRTPKLWNMSVLPDNTT